MLMLKERLLCKLLVDFELNADSEGQASVATMEGFKLNTDAEVQVSGSLASEASVTSELKMAGSK